MLSDYILFIDESGDHGLETIDENYPVFVLGGVLISKRAYTEEVCPAFMRLKMDFWGHAEVVFHEMELRKPRGQFGNLQHPDIREGFQARLTEIMGQLPYTLIFSIIRKREYANRYDIPRNPYELCMSAVLERAFLHLNSLGQGNCQTSVIVESRGKKEDNQLLIAFNDIVAGANACGRNLPFTVTMLPKLANSIGLQLVDLVARPVGLRAIRPNQPNRAFDVIKPKIRCDARGRVLGRGVKVFP